MYESFYLRAVAPDRPLGVWIRYTAHKNRARPPVPARGSVWCTVFDGADARPFMHKLTSDALSVPDGAWIAVGDSQLGPERAEGACGEARWSLSFASEETELRHLPHALLYRAPLPRTKLTSPAPAARFEGVLELRSAALDTAPLTAAESAVSPPSASALAARRIELDGWRGMVGHNWGAQHAERWIWLHGVGFEEEPEAWIDVAIGRLRVAGRTTPWVANGALHIDGERHRLGGVGARGLLVAERPERCVLSLPGAGGLTVEAHVQAPPAALAGWRYADPGGSHRGGGHGDRHHKDPSTPPAESHQHDVSNCSIAALALTVRRPGRPARTLRTAHGAAYELGMRERDHGVPIAPFADG
jgi:hypothetical protein